MQAEQQSGLLPCPFCGTRANFYTVEEGDEAGGRCIVCTNCNASSMLAFPLMDSVDEKLKEAWNRRAALSHPSPAQGWQPMDDGTMKTIMVQLGAKEVTSEGVVFFRKIEDAVLKVLSARAAGYPAGDGWASAPPPVVQGDKT